MKKQTLSAVPAWFDLKKYAGVAEFDIFDWFSNIYLRLMVQGGIDDKLREALDERMKADGLQVENDRSYYLSMLEQMLESPATQMRTKRKRTHDGGLRSGVVSDLSVLQVMAIAEELHKSEKYQAAWEAWEWSMRTSEEWIRERLKGKYDAIEDPAGDYMTEQFPSSGHYVYAEIDIHAPLDDLMESFRDWVKKLKSDRGVPFHSKRAFTDLDFKRWHKYAILPYFDLKLWATSTGVHIPDWLYVDALFGQMQGDTDGMFRKNTKPLEKEIMTQGCIDQLRNQGDIHF
jgi:hypothetical protein